MEQQQTRCKSRRKASRTASLGDEVKGAIYLVFGVWPALACRSAGDAELENKTECSVWFPPLQLETVENGGKLQGRRINFKRCYLLSIELLIKITPIKKKHRWNFACCTFFVKWKCPVWQHWGKKEVPGSMFSLPLHGWGGWKALHVLWGGTDGRMCAPALLAKGRKTKVKSSCSPWQGIQQQNASRK